MEKLTDNDVFIDSGWDDITSMLPTKGRFYEGHRLITRPYTFAEIEDMAKLSEFNQAEAFRQASRGLKFIAGPSYSGDLLSITDIYLGDFLFALLYRKVITLGEQEFTLADPVQGWTAEGISMEDISVKDMTAPALPATITLPSSGKTVDFWPLTLDNISNILDENSTSIPSISTYIDLMTRGKLSTSEVIGDKDARLIEAVDEALAHGFDPLIITNHNKELDQEGTTEIDLNASVFTVVLPFRTDGRVDEPKITFGSPSTNTDVDGTEGSQLP